MRNNKLKYISFIFFLIIFSNSFGQSEPGIRKGEFTRLWWTICNFEIRIGLANNYNNYKINFNGDYATLEIPIGESLNFTFSDIKGCLTSRKINRITVIHPNSSVYQSYTNSMIATQAFTAPGVYDVKLEIETSQNDGKDKIYYYTIGIKVLVFEFPGRVLVETLNELCKGKSFKLSPNNTDNFNDLYSYNWYDGSTLVTDYNFVMGSSIKKFKLKIYDKQHKFYYPSKEVNYNPKNVPQSLALDPVQDVSQCGIVSLSAESSSSLDWKNYFNKKTGIIFKSTPNANAKIFYGENCEDIKKKKLSEYTSNYNISNLGQNNLFIAAMDSKSGCWSECRPIVVNVNGTKPIPPVVEDKTICLCDKTDISLVASHSNPSNSTQINWYQSDSETFIKKGTSLDVTREDNIYYVSTFNILNECESEKVPVNVFTTPCNDCISEFAPIIGKKYVLSAWVKESVFNTSYSNAAITLSFDGNQIVLGPFKAKGPVIEGWQKIEEVFEIPAASVNLNLTLNNLSTASTNTNDVFFDDIRIHPFESNMISYVYDPETMRLTATLDENNFATYYTYDQEGNLVAVNKETIDGIKTIQESRTVLKR